MRDGRVFFSPGDAFTPSQSDAIIRLRPIETGADISSFECEFDEPEAPFGWPVIPGCAYSGSTVLVEFHRIDARRIVAISLNCATPPAAGSYAFRSYWLPEAGKAVLHGDGGWERVDIADLANFDHEHDTFDSTKIMPHAVRYAWRHVENDWWAIDENFNRFVRDDILGWRSDPLQARPLPLTAP